MLASITPLGERGRRGHWGITITAFVLGATGAGMTSGALAGGLGLLEPQARLAILAAGVMVAIVLDVRARRVPGPRRQVDERWLEEYRGWVYGLGYGAQLGLGVTTVVTSAATYVALLAAVLTANPHRGTLVVGCYGAIRGLTLIAGAGVRNPDQLLSLHARLARAQAPTSRVGLLVLVAIFALAVARIVT